MDEKNDFALVPKSPTAVEKAEPGAKRILAVIVADMLSLTPVEDPKTLFRKGQAYFIGDGVPKDAVEAAKLYRMAAEQGHADAQHNLGWMYYTLGATWRAPARITLTLCVHWIGRQFEDDENTLRLGEAVVDDLGASRPVTAHLELFLTIENIGNTRVETGRSADGVVNIGTPRLALGGVRASGSVSRALRVSFHLAPRYRRIRLTTPSAP